MCIAYVPPIDSKIHNTNEINMFECIESGIEKYKEHGHIYVLGDFNARTANLPDFLERDRFLDTNIELDYINIPERVNKDHVIDARTWTATCLLMQNHQPIYRKWSLRRK